VQRRVRAVQAGRHQAGGEDVVLAQRVLDRGGDARVAVPAAQDVVDLAAAEQLGGAAAGAARA
jgi:hypothetical protein